MRKTKVLFVSRYLAVGGERGNDEYVVAVLKALAAFGFEVDYLWLGLPPMHQTWHRIPPRIAPAARYWLPYMWRLGDRIAPRQLNWWWSIFLKRVWNFSQRVPLLRRLTLMQRIGKTLTDRLVIADQLFGRESPPLPVDAAAFRQAVAQTSPDIVMSNYYVFGPLFDELAGHSAAKVILTHDARHGYVAREVELAALRRAELLLAIQEDDLAELQREVPGRDVRLLPMPVVAAPRSRKPRPGRVVYVGSPHPSNIEGLRWFLHEVWPQVRMQSPDASFHVCGSINKAFPDPVAGVSFLGRLEDLAPEYAGAAIVVVPLLGGTGLKIKIVEALQHGCPVVATSFGLQGLGFAEDRCIVRADSAQDFAATLIRLLGDREKLQAMETEAFALVEKYFSPQACLQPFREWWENHREGQSG